MQVVSQSVARTTARARIASPEPSVTPSAEARATRLSHRTLPDARPSASGRDSAPIPEAGTATYVSEAKDVEAAPKSQCCGSARKFGTGWITSWGDTKYVSVFDASDLLAFRLKLPTTSYRAMPVPPGVSLRQLDQALNASEPDVPLGAPVRPIERKQDGEA